MATATKIHGKKQIKDATLDLGRLEIDFLKSTNWDINSGSSNKATITGIPDPINDLDVVNKHYADNLANVGGRIGNPEDGTFTDGLFTDFTANTFTGTAVDRINEVLKALAPSPAPNLTTATSATAGVTGKLSFDDTHTIANYTTVPTVSINGTYTVSGNIRGIINSSTAVTGTLASNVTPSYANSRPYPNLSFGDANTGSLHLELNGIIIHTTDLTTFTSGSSLTSGSGFTLSAATSVQFDNGNTLDLFKYRTGTLTIAAAVMRYGYNVVRVRHEYATGLYRDTNTVAWVVDNDVTATSYTAQSLGSLVLTGSKYLSGVQYYTGGTAAYGITIQNAYKNTFSSSASAITFNGTNCSIAAQSLPNTTANTDNVILSGKTATINATRLLNDSISVTTSTLRTVQSTITSSSSSISGILLDNTSADATNTNETFNDETFRMHAGLVLTNTSYGSGGAGASAYDWDSTQNLLTGDANHNTGLLISAGELTYPKVTSHIPNITNGNFSAPTNGPAGNPDYSSASGNRTYYRFFYDASARSNFRVNVTATSTTFVSVATGPSANNLTFEVLAPNTTVNGSGTVVWKDGVVAHSGNDTDVGCYAGTFGNSQPTNWGMTLGTKNTSTSGKVIVVKITASSAWTGKISNLTLTWL